MKTYTFHTKMVLDKDISRDVEVAGNVSLYRLAEAIVHAYGFEFDHAFGFYSKMEESYFDSEVQYELFADLEDIGEPSKAGSVKKTKVTDVWKATGDSMMFLFDYGDGWRFVVEYASVGSKKEGVKYPRVSKKVGRAPKQYAPHW